MSINIRKSALVAVAIVAALFVLAPHSASAAAHLGAGIWIYNSFWTISLINLTDYPLTYMREDEPDAYGYPWCGNGAIPMLAAGTDWQVDPYRTKIWEADRGGPVVPTMYHGKMTLYSKGFKEWAFDLVFVDQKADGVLEHGTWVALSPHEKSTTQAWAPASTSDNDKPYGRWATPVNDLAMHNIMTLIGPKIMVALYSSNNNDITVVVQQLVATDAPGNIVWDDRENTYKGNMLDFVDSGSTYVP
jgi:hypothetical protein